MGARRSTRNVVCTAQLASRVALENAFAGGHLGAVRVGDVGLEFLAFAVQSLVVTRQKLPRAGGFFAQAVNAGLAFEREILIMALRVLGLLQGHYFVGRLVQTFSTVAQFRIGAAALLAGVAGQFDAVAGEHLPADESLGVAGQQELADQGLDLLT